MTNNAENTPQNPDNGKYPTPPGVYIEAARVPDALRSQDFGDWRIYRPGGKYTYTILARKIYPEPSWENLHRIDMDGSLWDVVMDDSLRELRRHLPIFIKATGRVLKTGLGLGCVVRGLLIKPDVTCIDVVEIDADIIRVVGAEFKSNPRVNIIHADALTWQPTLTYDYVWHDIWTPENKGLALVHAELLQRYWRYGCNHGAWAFPREYKRKIRLIG